MSARRQSQHKVLSDPQQGHEYSRFFGLYVEIFQMLTSRQQNEVLNIAQAKKYPELPTKVTEIWYILSDFNAMCDNIWVIMGKVCWRLQSVGRFRERFIPKQSLCTFKVAIF